MTKKDILMVDDDWRFAEFVEKGADRHQLTLDQVSDGMGAVQFLQKEKRKYVCIILDGKFPICHPTPEVPPELEEFVAFHEKDNTSHLAGLTLLRYLQEKKWDKNGVLWVLSSGTSNRYLHGALKDWGVREKDIVYMEDKHYGGPEIVEEVFTIIKAMR